jgi:hypothetical protein
MSIKITKKFLKDKNACEDGYDWYLKQKTTDAEILSKLLISEEKFQWLSWAITRLMTDEQQFRSTIYAAEQVIDIFEKKYPEDKRPRKVILAAKKYLKNPSEKNKNAAYVAYADAYDAAYDADADAAYAARKKMRLKICKHGIKLLKKGE